VGKFWSLIFLSVPVLGVAVFVAAALDIYPLNQHWFPELVVADTNVDHLFNVILWMTGIVFVGTGVAMFWFLWKYDSSTNQQGVLYTHGSHMLEVAWSIVPAILLLFISIYQMDAWAGARMRRPQLSDGRPKPALARVTGRQFEWRIQYPGKDGKFDTPDDLYLVNELHVPLDEDVVLEIGSDDVLHSFFLPNFRIKQDVVPGMSQYVWFRPVKAGERFDIVCAELCGWGHYKMKGRVVVQTRDDLNRWLEQSYQAQETATFSLADAE